MSVWSWLKLTVCLWLLRKAVKAVRWLLLAVAAVATWPVTLVAVTGYAAAWLRGWPPTRLYRAAAWALPVTAAWLVILEVRMPGWIAARTPGRAWARGWDHLAPADLAVIGSDLAKAEVAKRVEVVRLRIADRNRFDFGDLHGGLPIAPRKRGIPSTPTSTSISRPVIAEPVVSNGPMSQQNILPPLPKQQLRMVPPVSRNSTCRPSFE